MQYKVNLNTLQEICNTKNLWELSKIVKVIWKLSFSALEYRWILVKGKSHTALTVSKNT